MILTTGYSYQQKIKCGQHQTATKKKKKKKLSYMAAC